MSEDRILTAEPFEHYNSEYYQKTVRLERACINGLTPDEVYAKESEFGLRVSGHDSPESFANGEGILDLACGEGNHSLHMAELLDGQIPVCGIDRSDALVRQANETLRNNVVGEVRENVKFAVGDMVDISSSEFPSQKFGLITVLGSSLGYSNMRDTQRSFENYYSILQPDGSLVIQSRLRDLNEPSADTQRRAQHILEDRKELGVHDAMEQRGDMRVFVIYDDTSGESFYTYSSDAEHPDPQHPDEYIEDVSVERIQDKRVYRHKETGIEFYAFGRMYFDAQGEHPLPPTTISTLMEEDNFPVLRDMLEKAGFVNIRFQGPETQEDYLGHHRLVAVVATKSKK